MNPTEVESVLLEVEEQRQMGSQPSAMVAVPVGESASDDAASHVTPPLADHPDPVVMQRGSGPRKPHHLLVQAPPRKSNRTNPLHVAQQSDSPGIHAPVSNTCNKCVYPRDSWHACNRNQLCRILLGGTGMHRKCARAPLPWRNECAKGTGCRKPIKPERQNATDHMKGPSMDNIDRHVTIVTGTLSSKE